jgi:hypothetical protein
MASNTKVTVGYARIMGLNFVRNFLVA